MDGRSKRSSSSPSIWSPRTLQITDSLRRKCGHRKRRVEFLKSNDTTQSLMHGSATTAVHQSETTDFGGQRPGRQRPGHRPRSRRRASLRKSWCGPGRSCGAAMARHGGTNLRASGTTAAPTRDGEAAPPWPRDLNRPGPVGPARARWSGSVRLGAAPRAGPRPAARTPP